MYEYRFAAVSNTNGTAMVGIGMCELIFSNYNLQTLYL